MIDSIVPSINDMEDSALALVSAAHALTPYIQICKGTDNETKLNGTFQCCTMVAQYLMNQAKQRRDLNDPIS